MSDNESVDKLFEVGDSDVSRKTEGRALVEASGTNKLVREVEVHVLDGRERKGVFVIGFDGLVGDGRIEWLGELCQMHHRLGREHVADRDTQTGSAGA